MTGAVPPTARWWDAPPARQVSVLSGVDPQLLELALDPLPEHAPAVIRYSPTAARSLGDQVAALLDKLDQVAVALFPHWLPGAHRLDGPHPLGIAAVRALAAGHAAHTEHFGPFLADLAARGLGERAAPGGAFPAAVRAAGLVRVLADAYGRESVALLVTLVDPLASGAEQILIGAAEWLVEHANCAVWFAGQHLRSAERITTVAVVLPEALSRLAYPVDGARLAPYAALRSGLAFPPLSGFPRQDSPAEQALERALVAHEWAEGRHWNHTYMQNPLSRAYRLDLFWPSERLVVEVDGPEHRGGVQFTSDRERDNRLQLLGHHVLRFTNEQVLGDVPRVVHQIRQLLHARRAAASIPAK